MDWKTEQFLTRISYSIAPKHLVGKNLWVGRHPDQEGVDPMVKFILSVNEEGIDYKLLPGQTGLAKSFPDRSAIQNPGLLHKLADKINSERHKHQVLVHCWLGINRSASIAALALIKSGMDPLAAITHIRKKRTKYCILNKTFREWLLAGAPV